MVMGAEEQFGNPTAEYVEVREVERVNGSKIRRPFSVVYLFCRLDRTILLVTFLANAPPHRASIIEVFEKRKVPSDARPGKFDPVINQKQETLRFENPLYTRSMS
jgi:hypothetical protein